MERSGSVVATALTAAADNVTSASYAVRSVVMRSLAPHW
jgi:hypothetical protein